MSEAFNLTDCIIYHGRLVSAQGDMITLQAECAGTPLADKATELHAQLAELIGLTEQRIVQLDPECAHPFTKELREKHAPQEA